MKLASDKETDQKIQDLALSFEHSRKSDLFVVVGSSLVVTPAAEMPREALKAGARLVIINDGATELDHVADVRVSGKAGDVMERTLSRVKEKLGLPS